MRLGARLLAVLAAASLAACGEADMDTQPKARTWDDNPFFPQNQTMRAPVAGTVPRADPSRPVPQPAAITRAMMDRGRERYAVFCTPCHGADGGGGIIAVRGLPPPGNLVSDDARRASASDLYRTISEGRRAMLGMGQMIPPADRWAIVAYLRALQLGRDAPVASLQAADRSELEAMR